MYRPTTLSILASEGNLTLFAVRAIFGCATGLGQAKIGEAKYHHYGSVDISTTNAPIEDRTKGCDSLRCNLPLANGIKKLLWFQIL